MKLLVVYPHTLDERDTVLTALKERLRQTDTAYVDFQQFSASAMAGKDAAVVLGGDGMIMRIAKAGASVRCPVLGINVGHLGFLAGLERNEFEGILSLLNGEYAVEERILLDITDELTGKTVLGMNEVVVSRGATSQLVTVGVECGEHEVLSFRGDGLIAATPTGSTAYSLSAGGPVVDPKVDCLLVTPVCPHTVAPHSLVLPSDKPLIIRACTTGEEPAFVTVDGETPFPLSPQGTVRVERSSLTARLIKIKPTTFFEVFSEKLLGQ